MRDVYYALRGFVRRPGLAVLAVLTCGLGIGSAAAMYSVVDGVLLRPLSWPDAGRVMAIYPTIEEWRTNPSLSESWDRARFSPPEFEAWAARQTSFAEATPLASWTRHLTGRGPAALVNVGLASDDLFRIADVTAVRGRLFTARDRAPGAAPVAVVTHAFWQTRLGGAAVTGEALVLNDVAHEIIGVLPPGFDIPGLAADIWVPARSAPSESERLNHSLLAIGRLADGVSRARARDETALLLAAMSGVHEDITHGANVVPLLEDRTRNVRVPLLLLLAGAGVLLLAACTNFATLLLGAGLDRSAELAVRGALGAGRRRIARLLLTESAVLAVLGGIAGVLLAIALTRALILLAPPGVPRIDQVAVDVRAVAFALAASLAVGIVFGLIPALALGDPDVAARLRAARSASRQRHRLHNALVVAQVALATVLLAGGVTLGRTLFRLDRVDPGFAPDRLLGVTVAPPGYRFLDADGAFSNVEYARYLERLADALADVPGVEAVAMTSMLPFTGSRMNQIVVPEGYEAAPGEMIVAEAAYVTGNYLEVIGARLVEGRLLTDADDRAGAAPAIVVSERFARRFWTGSALGRRLSVPGPDMPTYTIVGVVSDMRDRSLEADDDLRFYAPRAHGGPTTGNFALRVPGDPAAFADVVRQRIARYDADLPVTRAEPMRAMMDATLADARYRARLVLCFAALALFFATAGIYGALSRRVTLRRHEIGVRMALGARRARVVAGVLREGVALALAGLVIGGLLALAGNRILAAWLNGTTPADPVTFATIATILSIAAALAALAPSARAARVDPMSSLRGD